jgi:hypothetical protein
MAMIRSDKKTLVAASINLVFVCVGVASALYGLEHMIGSGFAPAQWQSSSLFTGAGLGVVVINVHRLALLRPQLQEMYGGVRNTQTIAAK